MRTLVDLSLETINSNFEKISGVYGLPINILSKAVLRLNLHNLQILDQQIEKIIELSKLEDRVVSIPKNLNQLAALLDSNLRIWRIVNDSITFARIWSSPTQSTNWRQKCLEHIFIVMVLEQKNIYVRMAPGITQNLLDIPIGDLIVQPQLYHRIVFEHKNHDGARLQVAQSASHVRMRNSDSASINNPNVGGRSIGNSTANEFKELSYVKYVRDIEMDAYTHWKRLRTDIHLQNLLIQQLKGVVLHDAPVKSSIWDILYFLQHCTKLNNLWLALMMPSEKYFLDFLRALFSRHQKYLLHNNFIEEKEMASENRLLLGSPFYLNKQQIHEEFLNETKLQTPVNPSYLGKDERKLETKSIIELTESKSEDHITSTVTSTNLVSEPISSNGILTNPFKWPSSSPDSEVLEQHNKDKLLKLPIQCPIEHIYFDTIELNKASERRALENYLFFNSFLKEVHITHVTMNRRLENCLLSLLARPTIEIIELSGLRFWRTLDLLLCVAIHQPVTDRKKLKKLVIEYAHCGRHSDYLHMRHFNGYPVSRATTEDTSIQNIYENETNSTSIEFVQNDLQRSLSSSKETLPKKSSTVRNDNSPKDRTPSNMRNEISEEDIKQSSLATKILDEVRDCITIDILNLGHNTADTDIEVKNIARILEKIECSELVLDSFNYYSQRLNRIETTPIIVALNNCHNLKKLSLRRLFCHNENARSLIANFISTNKLTRLDISAIELGFHATFLQEIATAFQSLSNLTELSLAENMIGDEGINLLIGNLFKSTIQSDEHNYEGAKLKQLDIDFNLITLNGFRSLIEKFPRYFMKKRFRSFNYFQPGLTRDNRNELREIFRRYVEPRRSDDIFDQTSIF
ncbi:hypothetical protein SNEBB_010329 [Seison nebaliae]|nr:hypothetical protein SNEBB_010329 [Seison nebaliae]